MKKIIFLLIMLFCRVELLAQATIPDSYYINLAKNKLKAEEAAMEMKAVIVGTRRGIIQYVIQDGVYTDYALEDDVSAPLKPVIPWFAPLLCFEPEEKDVKSNRKPVDKNAFAQLVKKLYAEGWSQSKSFGCPDGEVYVFEKKFAKEKKRPK